MPKVKQTHSINDVRILKILLRFGPLTRDQLASKFIDHMNDRNLQGRVRDERILYLLETDYIKTNMARGDNGLPEMTYELSYRNSLDRYIEDL